MRKIKRDYVTTNYQILESTPEGVKELGNLILEGEEDFGKARKSAIKAYPNSNCFIGDTHTTSATYEMSAEDFIKYATKLEKEEN